MKQVEAETRKQRQGKRAPARYGGYGPWPRIPAKAIRQTHHDEPARSRDGCLRRYTKETIFKLSENGGALFHSLFPGE
jgi:hypothetical protein